MAATELDILRDEQERGNLLNAVSEIETATVVAALGTRLILENSVENTKKRITTLDKKIEAAKAEQVAEVQMQAAAAASVLATKETTLNDSERHTYRSFPEEAYCTKRDFGRLDEFYAHSYDRLSEGSKDEVSKRIDEGVKRGEFKFGDPPANALEKEINHRVAKADKETPAQPNFSRSKQNSDCPVESAEAVVVKAIDLGSLNLSGVKLASASSALIPASIPDVSNSKVVER